MVIGWNIRDFSDWKGERGERSRTDLWSRKPHEQLSSLHCQAKVNEEGEGRMGSGRYDVKQNRKMNGNRARIKEPWNQEEGTPSQKQDHQESERACNSDHKETILLQLRTMMRQERHLKEQTYLQQAWNGNHTRNFIGG